jgi:hypothetical protein
VRRRSLGEVRMSEPWSKSWLAFGAGLNAFEKAQTRL